MLQTGTVSLSDLAKKDVSTTDLKNTITIKPSEETGQMTSTQPLKEGTCTDTQNYDTSSGEMKCVEKCDGITCDDTKKM